MHTKALALGKLASIPLVALAFACADGTLVEPEQNPSITANQDQAREPRQEYSFQFRLDEAIPPAPPPPIADGDFLQFFGNNRFVVDGDLTGYFYISGDATLNTITGEGHGSGGLLLVLTAPEFGGFLCRWRATYVGFFASANGEWYDCRGYGGFEGKKMRSENSNERDPAMVDATAVIWGSLGPRSDG